jgi:hypothetical protein
MTRPALALSPAARTQLLRLMESIRDYRPVVTVGWTSGGSRSLPAGQKEVPPGWGIGIYDSSTISKDDIVILDGIPFTFCQGAKSMELSGQTLDFDGHKFHVYPSAV